MNQKPGLWSTSALAWIVLLGSALMAVWALSTSFMVPQGVNWQLRLLIGSVSAEAGYHFIVWLFIPVGVSLCLLQRHRRVARAALVCSLVAVSFFARPLFQARSLGQILPARLTAAFGPGTADRPPFSFHALFAPLPEGVAYWDESYDRGRGRFEFMPAIGRSPAPCVIVLHGGGWFGYGFQDRRPFSFWLARQGYAVLALGYRGLPNGRWPDPRDDVLRAIAVVRADPGKYGVDLDKFILWGRSAGAQIALATAYAAHDRGIRGVIACYPPTDLRAAWKLGAISTMRLRGMSGPQVLQTFFGGTPETAGPAYDSASAVTLVAPDTPPTLIFHGSLDSLVPLSQSQELDAKLTAAGRPHLLVVVPWATHGFDKIDFNGPGAQITAYSVERFLAAVTR